MFGQGMAIDHRCGANHYSIELEKDASIPELIGRQEITAVMPNVLPSGGIPVLPGKLGNTVRQCDVRKLTPMLAEHSSELPVRINRKDVTGRASVLGRFRFQYTRQSARCDRASSCKFST